VVNLGFTDEVGSIFCLASNLILMFFLSQIQDSLISSMGNITKGFKLPGKNSIFDLTNLILTLAWPHSIHNSYYKKVLHTTIKSPLDFSELNKKKNFLCNFNSLKINIYFSIKQGRFFCIYFLSIFLFN